MQETLEMWVRSQGWEDPLEGGMATQSSVLAWRIPWTEEPGRPQSTGSQRVRQDWNDWAPSTVLLSTHHVLMMTHSIYNLLKYLNVSITTKVQVWWSAFYWQENWELEKWNHFTNATKVKWLGQAFELKLLNPTLKLNYNSNTFPQI